MTYYIKRKGQGSRETVDEFETRTEALKMLREYRISDPSAHYHMSLKPWPDWGTVWAGT